METTAAALARPQTFLAALDSEATERLFAAGQVRTFSRGSTLYMEGDRPSRALFLLRGLVKLVHRAADGRACILALLGPGEPVGVAALTGRHPAETTATTLTTAQVLSVPTEAWSSLVDRHADVAALLRALLARRLRDADRDRVALVMNDTLGRVAHRLVELSQRFAVLNNGTAGTIQFTLPLTQQELAEWAGASREATSRALHVLRERGLISISRRDVTILDLDRLERRANAQMSLL